MAEMIAGELLMECLANQGPAPVFGIPDGGYNIIYKWVHDNPDRGMHMVTPRHEAAGAHMADGFYRVTGVPAIAIAGAGPGAANLISGVITAAGEDIPMIVITTSRRSDLIAPLRGAMQTFEQVRAFRAVCKDSIGIIAPERIPAAVEFAYKKAMTGIPGPVNIDIPEDIFNSKVNTDEAPVSKCIACELLAASGGADPTAIEEAAKMLVEAEEAIIHCGATVVRSGAWKELRELAEYLGVAVCTTPGGRGAIPEDHPQSIPPVAGLARASMSQANVVLAVGVKFGELDFYGKPPLWGPPEMQKTIHIHRVPERIGMNRPADVALMGHAPIVLKQLLEAVGKLTEKRDLHPKVKQYKDLQMMGENENAQKFFEQDDPMTTGRVVKIVREFLERDAVIVQDGGNTSMWVANVIKILEPRTHLWTGDFGHLGTGVPYAIGAKLANQGVDVCLITGDGAFGFNIMELETAARENLPIICVVAADKAWGMEKTAQERCFGHKDYYVNVEHAETRYDKVAEAMGCFGAYVERADQMKTALYEAKQSCKPAVIHVAVDAEANVYPPGNDLWVGSKAAK